MRSFAYVIVVIVAVLGLLLLMVSVAAPAIAQAAIGSMVTAFVVCCLAIAIALDRSGARRSE